MVNTYLVDLQDFLGKGLKQIMKIPSSHCYYMYIAKWEITEVPWQPYLHLQNIKKIDDWHSSPDTYRLIYFLWWVHTVSKHTSPFSSLLTFSPHTQRQIISNSEYSEEKRTVDWKWRNCTFRPGSVRTSVTFHLCPLIMLHFKLK